MLKIYLDAKEWKDACLKHNYSVKINKFMRTSFEEFQSQNFDKKNRQQKICIMREMKFQRTNKLRP